LDRGGEHGAVVPVVERDSVSREVMGDAEAKEAGRCGAREDSIGVAGQLAFETPVTTCLSRRSRERITTTTEVGAAHRSAAPVVQSPTQWILVRALPRGAVDIPICIAVSGVADPGVPVAIDVAIHIGIRIDVSIARHLVVASARRKQ